MGSPLTPSVLEECMREVASTLDDLELEAARPALRTDGVDPCLRSYVHAVSRMGRGALETQPAAACLGPEGDVDKTAYHALVACFLASRAEHARPEDDPDEAHRMECLQRVLEQHCPRWMPALYTVRGLHYSELSPVTLVSHGTTLYVAGRGSKTPPDFVADCRMDLTRVGGAALVLHGVGQAHKGILHAFTMQVKGVLRLVDRLVAQDLEQRRVDAVVFCGHSLGGALAQMLGLAYAQRRRRGTIGLRAVPSRVVSFGSPRLGDRELRGLLNEYTNHERLYVHKDPIAGVPSPTNKEFRGIFPVVKQYAPHHANRSWELSTGHAASASEPNQPQVRSVFAWMCRGGRHNHRLTMYASCLKFDLSQRSPAAAAATAAAAL